MLIIFSGLPGSGKSTIAQKLSQEMKAVYLRVDTIEQTLRSNNASTEEIGSKIVSVIFLD